MSLDDALTETTLVLGSPPAAMPDGQAWDTWVVEPVLPMSVQNLGSDQEINLELLATCKPRDVVVVDTLPGHKNP